MFQGTSFRPSSLLLKTCRKLLFSLEFVTILIFSTMSKSAKKAVDELREHGGTELELVDRNLVNFSDVPGLCKLFIMFMMLVRLVVTVGLLRLSSLGSNPGNPALALSSLAHTCLCLALGHSIGYVPGYCLRTVQYTHFVFTPSLSSKYAIRLPWKFERATANTTSRIP